MHYTGQVYRPPREAFTPLLQVTTGCSHNKCAFCSMFNMTPFGLSPLSEVEEDLIEMKNTWSYPLERIYLVNGDPFVLSRAKLEEIANLVHKYHPQVKTITCYASFYNLKNKTVEDLKVLRAHGFNELYIGVETGYGPALEMINKGVNLEEAYQGLDKLKEAGMDYNAIIMMGIAGRGRGKDNAQATAKFLNHYPPRVINVMSTTINQGTKLAQYQDQGLFVQATEGEILEEQVHLLKNLEMPEDVTFTSQHMVNLIHIQAKMAQKDQIIGAIEKKIKDTPQEVLDRTINRMAT